MLQNRMRLTPISVVATTAHGYGPQRVSGGHRTETDIDGHQPTGHGGRWGTGRCGGRRDQHRGAQSSDDGCRNEDVGNAGSCPTGSQRVAGHARSGAEGSDVPPGRASAARSPRARRGTAEDQGDPGEAEQSQAGERGSPTGPAGGRYPQCGQQRPPVGDNVGRHDGCRGERDVLQEDRAGQPEHADQACRHRHRTAIRPHRQPSPCEDSGDQEGASGGAILHQQQPAHAHPVEGDLCGQRVGRPQRDRGKRGEYAGAWHPHQAKLLSKIAK